MPTNTQNSDATNVTEKSKRAKRLYTAIWRWHFYAGLLVIPITILLGLTGSIYLFKPYVEPILYRDMWQVAVQDERVAADAEIAAAKAAYPDLSLRSLTPGDTLEKATEIGMRNEAGETILVYTNPYSGEVTGDIVRDDMFMRKVRAIHGTLLLGDAGSYIVELTACWAIVLLITGIYLWWPRPTWRVMGVFWPRLSQGKRIFWRDLHAVVAMYASAIILTLIMTGLPWSQLWGGSLDRIQDATGQNTPAVANRFGPAPFKSTVNGNDAISVAQAIEIAEDNGLPRGYTLDLPRGEDGVYRFWVTPIDVDQTQYLYLDQYSGEVVGAAGWDSYPATAKAVTMGIRLHQGELFGIANLLLMLFAALSMVWMSATAAIMWWQRRPSGKIGAPKLPDNWTIPRGITIITIALGIFYPLVGVSLIILFLLDKFIIRHLPGAKGFFNLT